MSREKWTHPEAALNSEIELLTHECHRLHELVDDLLAVCERFDAWERDPDRYAGDLADMVVQARAAIAKAKGEAK